MRYTYILILMLILSACKTDIETFDFRGDEHLCINGIINNLKPENYIYCSYLSGNKRTIISNADIRLYVNGNLAETITQGDAKGRFGIKTKFQGGDHVRLEVSAADTKAWAEVDVPLPVEIVKLDTVMTKATFETWYEDEPADDIYRVRASIRTPYPNGGYYRMLAGGEATNVYGWAETEFVGRYWNKEPECYKLRDSISLDRICCPIEIKEDMALTNGKGFVDGGDADFFGLSPWYYNNYQLFTGEYFNGDTYTLQYYLQPWLCVCPMMFQSGEFDVNDFYGYSSWDVKLGQDSWLKDKYYRIADTFMKNKETDDEKEEFDYFDFSLEDYMEEFHPEVDFYELPDEQYWALFNEYYDWKDSINSQYEERCNIIFAKSSDPSMFCQVISISKEEYQYLNARSNQYDTDFYSPLTEPITMPSNIHGGLGVFFIESATEKSVKIPSATLIGRSWDYEGRHWVSVPRS